MVKAFRTERTWSFWERREVWRWESATWRSGCVTPPLSLEKYWERRRCDWICLCQDTCNVPFRFAMKALTSEMHHLILAERLLCLASEPWLEKLSGRLPKWHKKEGHSIHFQCFIEQNGQSNDLICCLTFITKRIFRKGNQESFVRSFLVKKRLTDICTCLISKGATWCNRV